MENVSVTVKPDVARLLKNGKKLAIWGVGYIGLSNMIYYGKEGIKTIGIDPIAGLKEKILNKECMENINYWIGFDFDYIFEQAIADIVNKPDLVDFDNIVAHLVCVPTEKNLTPYDGALFDVANTICKYENQCRDKKVVAVLVESTMIPGTAKRLEDYMLDLLDKDKELYFGVSPRRDWFLSSDKNLELLPRVLGANSRQALAYFKDILGIVCRNIVLASDARHAEITKCVENAFRHLDITLANQLSDAFPELDIREVLRLAGTKWNMNTYTPSFGTGGYCIPLSSQYLLKSKNGELLSLLQETVKIDQNRPYRIFEIIKRLNAEKVGILGVSYKEDIKVDKNSAVLKIIECCNKNFIDVYVNDPYYTKEELNERFGVKHFDCFNYSEYSKFDVLIMFTSHRQYKLLDVKAIVDNLKRNATILDNTGAWEEASTLFQAGISYRLVGKPGWNE